jgi:hypothetical protein
MAKQSQGSREAFEEAKSALQEKREDSLGEDYFDRYAFSQGDDMDDLKDIDEDY